MAGEDEDFLENPKCQSVVVVFLILGQKVLILPPYNHESEQPPHGQDPGPLPDPAVTRRQNLSVVCF